MKKEEYIKCSEEITDWDQKTFEELASVELSDDQREIISTPPFVREKEESVLAIHWHPEIAPMDLIEKRIDAMFPNHNKELIIPTQHNELLTYKGYSGVEVDCYAKGFNRKVQLLFHFEKSKIEKADILKSMLAHTFKYRSSQFFEFLNTLLEPAFTERLNEAVKGTQADKEIVDFTTTYAKKLDTMVKANLASMPPQSVKNKLLPNYFTKLKKFYDENTINKSLVFLKKVKKIVKRNFSLEYFYEANEMIEEVRGLGGGIIVPHPEQFWPILLADYDVDGYEVWNPQSREFTEFLINVVVNKNKAGQYRNRPLIITMGDDTHLGEKIKPEDEQNIEKASREIGCQPPWNDLDINKSLILGNFEKCKIIHEYMERIK